VLYNKSKTTLHTYPSGKTASSFAIPTSVTSIGDCAFKSCSNLTDITIPNSVTSIGTLAFYLCTGITSITIPDSVTQIIGGSFIECTHLTSVTFEGIIPPTGFVFHDSFEGDLLDKYLNGGPGTYTRPNSSSTTWTKQ